MQLASRRPSRPRGSQLELGAVLAGASFALALSVLLVKHSSAAALALALLPLLAWLLTRSYGGLALGTAFVLVLPSWEALGTAQASVLRLASVAAATSLLVNRRFRLTSIDFALLVYVAIVLGGW